MLVELSKDIPKKNVHKFPRVLPELQKNEFRMEVRRNCRRNFQKIDVGNPKGMAREFTINKPAEFLKKIVSAREKYLLFEL